jgi:uncharacterized protein YjbJ (UPF0337 family)
VATGKGDELKGKLKEGLGTATGDDRTRKEGQGDQAKGKVKQAGGKLADAVKDVTRE